MKCIRSFENEGAWKSAMKVLLSKNWHYEMITFFCIQVFCIIMCVLSLCQGNGVMFLLSLYGVIMMAFVEIVILCSCHRFLTYVVVSNDVYTSYILKKRLCEIDRKKTIYYVIFSANEGVFSRKDYIVLSNDPFEYEEKCSLRIFPWEKRPLLAGYDTKKQIALPYNQETRLILEIEKWKLVNKETENS